MGNIVEQIFGGESPGEREKRQSMERKVTSANDTARGLIGQQYFGSAATDVQGLNALQALRNMSPTEISLLLNDPNRYDERDALINAIRYVPGASNIYNKLIEDPYALMTDPSIMGEIDTQVRNIQSGLEDKLTVQPYTVDQLTTSYDVEKYDPTKLTNISEYEQSTQNPDLYDIPSYESAAMQESSKAAEAKADVEGLAQQRDALRAISDVYKQGGLTDADRARIELARQNAGQYERAQREAALENLRQRGLGGAGAELQAALAASEGGADQLYQDKLAMEIAAEQRALDAMRDSMSGGQQLAEDVYRRGYQTGTAQDVVNQYNTQGARDVQAATRTAQDAEADWRRNQLQRDTAAQRIVDAANAQAQTAADQWYAGQRTDANQWGMDTANRNKQFNALQQSAADTANANIYGGQIAGQNTQQGNLANLGLAEANAWNAVHGTMATPNIGTALGNIGNVIDTSTAIGQFLTNPVGVEKKTSKEDAENPGMGDAIGAFAML